MAKSLTEEETVALSDKVGTRRHHRKSTIMVTPQLRFFTDSWTMGEPIGQPGAFGIAYLCYKNDDSERKQYVVKQISKAKFYHIEPKERDTILSNMSNEITLQKQLSHKNICTLIDVYEDRNYIHLVMEHLSGGELFDRICEEDGFSEAKAAKIAKQILEAISFMHSKNICHLDLKPDNILFDTMSENSNIKVIDFGMAQVVPRLKKLKQTVGTPYYTAPEVLSGNYDRAADVWSIGVMIFCMLFGYPPHYVDIDDIKMGESEEDAIYNLVKQGFTPKVKEGYGPWFPAEIPVSEYAKDILSKMLAFDVKDRVTAEEALTHPWIRDQAEVKKLPATVFRSLTTFKNTNRFKMVVSRLFAQKLDPQRYAETIEVFKKWDKNGDGALTMEEFREGMKSATRLNENEIDSIFNEIDIDDNRLITVDELVVSSAFDALVAVDERMFDAFNEMDTDNDGYIEVNELKKAITRLKLQDLGRAESILDEIQTKMKGKINYEEFLRALHPTLNEMNPNDMSRLRTRGFGTMDQESFNKYVFRTKKAQLVDGILNANFLMKSLSVDIQAPPNLAENDRQVTSTMTLSGTSTRTVIASGVGGRSATIQEHLTDDDIEEDADYNDNNENENENENENNRNNDNDNENDNNNKNSENNKNNKNNKNDKSNTKTKANQDDEQEPEQSNVPSGCCFIL